MATIQGIEGLSLEEVKEEIGRGARFVTFRYCISIFIMTFLRESDIHFVRADEGTAGRSIGYTLATLAFGWWGFPWGPIHSINALYTNLNGGRDVTAEVEEAITPAKPLYTPPAHRPAPSPQNAPSAPRAYSWPVGDFRRTLTQLVIERRLEGAPLSEETWTSLSLPSGTLAVASLGDAGAVVTTLTYNFEPDQSYPLLVGQTTDPSAADRKLVYVRISLGSRATAHSFVPLGIHGEAPASWERWTAQDALLAPAGSWAMADAAALEKMGAQGIRLPEPPSGRAWNSLENTSLRTHIHAVTTPDFPIFAFLALDADGGHHSIVLGCKVPVG